MKNKITIKDKILYLLLPFTIGCSTATATTPKANSSWGQSMNKVSGYSQLDYTEPAIEPDWLRKTPRAKGSYFFVGMSNKRSERKDAKNESFNDAMIAFARFCGLNVSVMEEHKDISIGGNGGVIDTLTRGNTFAKLRADMFMGNVTVEDRFLERYSNFHGGSFMGHAFVVSTLIKVPHEEMETCRANRKTANSFMEEQSETIAKLSKKNSSLENRLQQVERNNQTLAMNQVMQTNKLFEQAGYAKKEPVVKKVVKRNVKKTANSVSKIIVKKKKYVPKKVVATNTSKDKCSGRLYTKAIGNNDALRKFSSDCGDPDNYYYKLAYAKLNKAYIARKNKVVKTKTKRVVTTTSKSSDKCSASRFNKVKHVNDLLISFASDCGDVNNYYYKQAFVMLEKNYLEKVELVKTKQATTTSMKRITTNKCSQYKFMETKNNIEALRKFSSDCGDPDNYYYKLAYNILFVEYHAKKQQLVSLNN